MMEAPFALAFTAGLVATVNPCGFAMLPAYLGYFMGLEDGDAASGPNSLGRALRIGGIVASGFLLVFGVVGVLVTLGMRSIISAVPWAAIVVGVGIAVLGIAMLRGYEPKLSLPAPGRVREGRGATAVFLFGVSYAVASLSCTLPIFLAVVAGAIPNSTLLGGLLLFVVYGLGMSLVLVAVTVALALGRQRLVGRLRRSAAYVNRVSGAVLVLAGGYIVWFWATNLRDPLAASGPISTVETWSSRVTELIGNSPLAWGIGLGAVVLTAAVQAWRHHRGEAADDTEPTPNTEASL